LAASAAAIAIPAVASAQAPVGPRKRVAVAKFDSNGAFQAAYGGYDPGGGLAAQLTTALVESGRFVVVERADVANVLNEQALGASHITGADTAAKAGEMLGAQILVRGSVTSFDQQAKGGGLSLGFGGSNFGGALSRRTNTGTIGIDVRLIDTTTGQVIGAKHFDTTLKTHGITVDATSHSVMVSGDNFDKTVLGQATRQAIDQAVGWIQGALANVAWIGRVTDVKGDQVFLNVGAASGANVGQLFDISRVDRKITDPDSGELLGIVESRLGQVELAIVQDRFSIGARKGDFEAQRGDIARLARP
jgi:curli biogenesis system outer membrane secretion channel CsgG